VSVEQFGLGSEPGRLSALAELVVLLGRQSPVRDLRLYDRAHLFLGQLPARGVAGARSALGSRNSAACRRSLGRRRVDGLGVIDRAEGRPNRVGRRLVTGLQRRGEGGAETPANRLVA
jgi:hypothetical protein